MRTEIEEIFSDCVYYHCNDDNFKGARRSLEILFLEKQIELVREIYSLGDPHDSFTALCGKLSELQSQLTELKK